MHAGGAARQRGALSLAGRQRARSDRRHRRRDAQRFVEANEPALRLFKMTREQLLNSNLERGQRRDAARRPAGQRRRASTRSCAGRPGESQVFEWVHRDSTGRDIPCDVRLVRLPGGAKPLVRASITDISERKRAEIIMENERAFFALLASNAGLPAVLDVISALVQAVYPRCALHDLRARARCELFRADDRPAAAADARGGARAHADRAAARLLRRRRVFGLRRVRARRGQRSRTGPTAARSCSIPDSAPSGRCPSRAPAASC